jgi:hypothetical protein
MIARTLITPAIIAAQGASPGHTATSLDFERTYFKPREPLRWREMAKNWQQITVDPDAGSPLLASSNRSLRSTLTDRN